MKAIKSFGEIYIVQDSDMPRNALNSVNVDHYLPISGMGALPNEILKRKSPNRTAAPEDVLIEAKIAEWRIRAILESADNANGDDIPT